MSRRDRWGLTHMDLGRRPTFCRHSAVKTTPDCSDVDLAAQYSRPSLFVVKGERCTLMRVRASPSARPLTPRAGPLCTAASITPQLQRGRLDKAEHDRRSDYVAAQLH